MHKSILTIALAILFLTTGMAGAADYGTTPTLKIPALGDGGWGTSINQSLKNLTDFNANFANADGTLKAGVTATQWAQGPVAYYISASSINIQGDQTSLFEIGRKVWVNQAIDVIGTVQSATYGSGWTAVTLSPIVLYSDNVTASTITNNITSISVGLNTPRSDPGAPESINTGYIRLGRMNHSGTTQTTIQSSIVEISDGTTSRTVYWDSALVFDYGPTGSNSGSAALGAKQWHYIYILSAAVASGGGVIVAGNLYNTTVAPSYNQSSHGWYNGNDRCIAAFRTNGSSTLEQMMDAGNGWIQVATWQAGAGFDFFLNGGGATAYTVLSPDVPVGTTSMLVNFQYNLVGQILLSFDGATDAHYIGYAAQNGGLIEVALNPVVRQFYYKVIASGNFANLLTAAYHTNY